MHNIELLAIHDQKTNGMAICLKPKVPYIITPSLVHEVRKLQNKIAEQYYTRPWEGVYYILWYLHNDTAPWIGLDYHFIQEALTSHRERQMEHYIETVFELLFINYVGFDLPLINCSIVNRKLSGVSQDFFYVNRINFIKHYSCSNILPFNKLNFNSGIRNTSFPLKLYTRNYFYSYNSIDLKSMKKFLVRIGMNPYPNPSRMKLNFCSIKLARKQLKKFINWHQKK